MPRHQPKRFTFNIPSPVHDPVHSRARQWPPARAANPRAATPFLDYDSGSRYSPLPSPAVQSPAHQYENLRYSPSPSATGGTSALHISLLSLCTSNSRVFNYDTFDDDHDSEGAMTAPVSQPCSTHKRNSSDPLAERRRFPLRPLVIPVDPTTDYQGSIAMIDAAYDNLSALKEPEPAAQEVDVAFDLIDEWMQRATIGVQSPTIFPTAVIEQHRQSVSATKSSIQSQSPSPVTKLKVEGPSTMLDRRRSLGLWREWFK